MSIPYSSFHIQLTLNAPIATKVVCFSRLLNYLRSLYGKQCGTRSDCSYRFSRFTLFATILNTSVMLGNYLQQMTSADNIFRCIFFLGALRVKDILCWQLLLQFNTVSFGTLQVHVFRSWYEDIN